MAGWSPKIVGERLYESAFDLLRVHYGPLLDVFAAPDDPHPGQRVLQKEPTGRPDGIQRVASAADHPAGQVGALVPTSGGTSQR